MIRCSIIVFGIEIHRDRSHGNLGFSQKAYMDLMLKLSNMEIRSHSENHSINTIDRVSKDQFPRNDTELSFLK